MSAREYIYHLAPDPCSLALIHQEVILTDAIRVRFAPSPTGHLHIGGRVLRFSTISMRVTTAGPLSSDRGHRQDTLHR